MWKRLLLIVVVLVLAFFVYSRITGQTSEMFSPGLTAELQKVFPEPSPTPYTDVTIPYLRNRSYDSDLGELKPYQDNNSYTSYLTNYSSDGLQINGLLTRPKGEMPAGGWPAIVFVHGYIAPSVYKTTERYVSYVDYLAKQGFVVFKVDLRGHADSEGEASGAYYSGDYIVDVLNARSALQKSDFVSDKVGLWGHSMAGNVSFRALAVAQDIDAVVIWAGAVYTYEDFMEYGISDNSYRPPASTSPSRRKREEMMQTHGAFHKDSEFWRQVAPTNYLAGITTPIEIHHAVDDPVVPVEYSRNLMSKLAGASIPHELFEYESGGHDIEGASFNTAMSRTASFFSKQLK
jgi:dipeptidyl aminopeptidase/acylaminoacyl peptidase